MYQCHASCVVRVSCEVDVRTWFNCFSRAQLTATTITDIIIEILKKDGNKKKKRNEINCFIFHFTFLFAIEAVHKTPVAILILIDCQIKSKNQIKLWKEKHKKCEAINISEKCDTEYDAYANTKGNKTKQKRKNNKSIESLRRLLKKKMDDGMRNFDRKESKASTKWKNELKRTEKLIKRNVSRCYEHLPQTNKNSLRIQNFTLTIMSISIEKE